LARHLLLVVGQQEQQVECDEERGQGHLNKAGAITASHAHAGQRKPFQDYTLQSPLIPPQNDELWTQRRNNF
jgi:hypothetical protein